MEAYVISSEMNVAMLKMDISQALLHFCKLGKLRIHAPVRWAEMNWTEPSLLKTVYGFKGSFICTPVKPRNYELSNNHQYETQIPYMLN